MNEPMPNVRLPTPSARFSRTVVGLLGVSHLALGYYTAKLGYLPAPAWFGLLFVLAAVCSFIYAATGHPGAAIYAATASVTAYAMRAGALVVGYTTTTDSGLSSAQVNTGVIVFATLILAWGAVFWKFTVPNAAVRRRARSD